MYSEGLGVNQDYKQAMNWYKKAAEQGSMLAQYDLGLMYGKGQGTPQNYKYAYVWSCLAAAQGDESAKNNRDIFAKKLSPQHLGEAQELAAGIQYKIDHPFKK
jgi:TPR repeat protein